MNFWMMAGMPLIVLVVFIGYYYWKTDRADRCYTGGLKHKFEACVVEKDSPHADKLISNTGEIRGSLLAYRDLLVLRCYIRHVCVWCGKTAERTNEP